MDVDSNVFVARATSDSDYSNTGVFDLIGYQARRKGLNDTKEKLPTKQNSLNEKVRQQRGLLKFYLLNSLTVYLRCRLPTSLLIAEAQPVKASLYH